MGLEYERLEKPEIDAMNAACQREMIKAHRKAVLRQQAHMNFPLVAAFLTLVGLVALAVFIRWLING